MRKKKKISNIATLVESTKNSKKRGYQCPYISLWFQNHSSFETNRKYFISTHEYMAQTIYKWVFVYVWCMCGLMCGSTCNGIVWKHFSKLHIYWKQDERYAELSSSGQCPLFVHQPLNLFVFIFTSHHILYTHRSSRSRLFHYYKWKYQRKRESERELTKQRKQLQKNACVIIYSG